MSPEEYARGVANHILSHNPSPRYWRGTWSAAIKILHRFFPPVIYVASLTLWHWLTVLIVDRISSHTECTISRTWSLKFKMSKFEGLCEDYTAKLWEGLQGTFDASTLCDLTLIHGQSQTSLDRIQRCSIALRLHGVLKHSIWVVVARHHPDVLLDRMIIENQRYSRRADLAVWALQACFPSHVACVVFPLVCCIHLLTLRCAQNLVAI